MLPAWWCGSSHARRRGGGDACRGQGGACKGRERRHGRRRVGREKWCWRRGEARGRGRSWRIRRCWRGRVRGLGGRHVRRRRRRRCREGRRCGSNQHGRGRVRRCRHEWRRCGRWRWHVEWRHRRRHISLHPPWGGCGWRDRRQAGCHGHWSWRRRRGGHRDGRRRGWRRWGGRRRPTGTREWRRGGQCRGYSRVLERLARGGLERGGLRER